MEIFETLENNTKQILTQNLHHAIKLRGIKCIHKKVKESTYTDVYGQHAQNSKTVDREVRILVTGDLFTVSGGSSLSTFQEGYAYSQDPEISSGDNIEIKRRDGKTRRYFIKSRESIGTTDTLMYRFMLSPRS